MANGSHQTRSGWEPKTFKGVQSNRDSAQRERVVFTLTEVLLACILVVLILTWQGWLN